MKNTSTFHLLCLMLLMGSCEQKLPPGVYERPLSLFDQTYPESTSLLNYTHQIPDKILYEVDFNAYISPHKKGIKTIYSESYSDNDTLWGKIAFDQHGNVMYQKRDIDEGEGIIFRYSFNEAGLIAAKHTYAPNSQLYASLYFYYNTKNEINRVVSEYAPQDIFQNEPRHWMKDSTEIEYQSGGQLTRVGDKIFTYDDRGNCIEWKIGNTKPFCGNTTTHWKGTYNDQDSLISSWSDGMPGYPTDSSAQAYWPTFMYNSTFSTDGKLITELTYLVGLNDTTLWGMERFEYY